MTWKVDKPFGVEVVGRGPATPALIGLGRICAQEALHDIQLMGGKGIKKRRKALDANNWVEAIVIQNGPIPYIKVKVFSQGGAEEKKLIIAIPFEVYVAGSASQVGYFAVTGTTHVYVAEFSIEGAFIRIADLGEFSTTRPDYSVKYPVCGAYFVIGSSVSNPLTIGNFSRGTSASTHAFGSENRYNAALGDTIYQNGMLAEKTPFTIAGAVLTPAGLILIGKFTNSFFNYYVKENGEWKATEVAAIIPNIDSTAKWVQSVQFFIDEDKITGVGLVGAGYPDTKTYAKVNIEVDAEDNTLTATVVPVGTAYEDVWIARNSGTETLTDGDRTLSGTIVPAQSDWVVYAGYMFNGDGEGISGHASATGTVTYQTQEIDGVLYFTPSDPVLTPSSFSIEYGFYDAVTGISTCNATAEVSASAWFNRDSIVASLSLNGVLNESKEIRGFSAGSGTIPPVAGPSCDEFEQTIFQEFVLAGLAPGYGLFDDVYDYPAPNTIPFGDVQGGYADTNAVFAASSITATFDYWTSSDTTSFNRAPVSSAAIPYRVAFDNEGTIKEAAVSFVNSFENNYVRNIYSSSHYDITGSAGMAGVSYEKGVMTRYKSFRFGIGPFKIRIADKDDFGKPITVYEDYPLGIGVHSIEEESSSTDTATSTNFALVDFGYVGDTELSSVENSEETTYSFGRKTGNTSRKEGRYVFDADPEYGIALIYDYANDKVEETVVSEAGQVSLVYGTELTTLASKVYSGEGLDTVIKRIEELNWRYGTSSYVKSLGVDTYSAFGFSEGRVYSLPLSIANLALVSGGWWMGDAGGQAPAGFVSKVLIKPSEDEEQNTINQTRANSIQSYFDTNFAGKDLRFLGLSMFQQTFEVN